jgi:transcriptional regulator with XRE-family HTH domain
MVSSRTPPDIAWIAEQLKLHRLAQNDLAAVLGINASGVTRLLRGERRLRPEEVPLLHRFFSQFSQSAVEPPTRLIRAMSMPQMDIAELSRRTNLTVERLLQIKYGQAAPASQQERLRLSGAFAQSAEFLFSSEPLPRGGSKALRDGWMGRPAAQPNAKATRSTAVTRLPVYRPLSSSVGYWFEDRFALAERREPPPLLREVPDGFGVYIETPILVPLACPGEVLWVHPGRPVWENSRVLVRTSMFGIAFGVLQIRRDVRRLSVFGYEPYPLGPDDVVQAVVAIDTH